MTRRVTIEITPPGCKMPHYAQGDYVGPDPERPGRHLVRIGLAVFSGWLVKPLDTTLEERPAKAAL